MPLTAETRHSLGSRGIAPTIPATEASGRHSSEFVVIPGSKLYGEWLALLRHGLISYEEFMDWTTPDHTMSVDRRHAARLHKFRRALSRMIDRLLR